MGEDIFLLCQLLLLPWLLVPGKREWRVASQRERRRGAGENGRCSEEAFKVTEPRRRGEEVSPKRLATSLRVHGIFSSIRIPSLSRGGDERCNWGERESKAKGDTLGK